MQWLGFMAERFFKKNSSSSIKCLACRHYCIIPESGFGLCGARKNFKGKLELVTHSKPCSLHLDPIEKKPLFHYLPGSGTMSIGFFGCNFRCEFCQNSEISFLKNGGAEKASNELGKVSPKDFVALAVKQKAKSIAITYNEPAISVEYNLEAIALAKKTKLNDGSLLGTVYVSNGYASEEQTKALTKNKKTRLDAINIDLKSFNENFYRKICGAELEKVLEGIKSFYEAGVWVELTTLLIPGRNDSKEELKQIADFILSVDKNIPWHISAFFPHHKMINVPPTSAEEIVRAVKLGQELGLNFVYGGNVYGAGFEDTHCPKCGNLLIKRISFGAEIVGLSEEEKNKCGKCGEKIAGVF
jgi:pyruvate formate lyase activating enzyme